ncbi:hypothetical protein [Leifsonia poae]|uniref:hypothetical protein n=1 Tax=Leifsonia poae TaxID=110933 RepID=UPI001CBD61A4|nr:hypothetical protein [Leifsonia poae]
MTEETPIAYTALQKGVPVVTADGTEIGRVEHVLHDPSLDLFDGIAVSTAAGLRFVDADLVQRITTGAVQTTLTDDTAADLPRPQGEEVLSADPEQLTGTELSARLGRLFLREHWTHPKR